MKKSITAITHFITQYSDGPTMNAPGILDAKTNIPDNFDNFLSPLREPSDFCKTFKMVVNTNFPPNHDVAIYSNV